MRILLLEDHADLRAMIAAYLTPRGFAVDSVAQGSEALAALSAAHYDALILDLGLPDMDGLAVCRTWRNRGGRTPMLALTARTALADRVTGLDAGVDDYLPKPFAIEELLARLRALLRRPPAAPSPQLHVADLQLDPATRSVRRGARSLRMSAREYALLEYLLRNPDRVLSRGQILEHVWDDNFDPVANAVDVLVGRVRRKVEADGGSPLIHTIRGAGYMLSEAVPPNAG
jgi:DNA-binding response OmpR family regulator